MKNCKFCQLGKDEKIVFRTENFLLLKNKFPIIRNHYLLISREHLGEEKEIKEEHWQEYFKICQRTYNFVKKKTGREPLTFINPPQMQSINHFHRHYIDGVFGIHGVAIALENFLKKRCKKFGNRPILVSACLAGIKCRYNGTSATNKRVVDLVKEGKAFPLCPEQLGGLPTPRPAAERKGNKIITRKGKDYSQAFQQGAKEGLRIAKLAGCQKAVLKARSPSCGCGRIYDGSFSGKLIKGDGVFAVFLKKAGIKIVSL